MCEKIGQRALPGVYRAEVTDTVDPLGSGRVEVRLIRPKGDLGREVRRWAPWCSPYADDGQGLQILPEVGSDVVVAFEAGDLDHPIVLGALWGSGDALPEPPLPANDVRVLQTRSGSRLEFDDDASAPAVRLTTAAGHSVVLEDDEVTISHGGGSTIRLTAATIEITASGPVTVKAPALDVAAPLARFDGTVTCATLIASASVVSPAYSPGVGNIL